MQELPHGDGWIIDRCSIQGLSERQVNETAAELGCSRAGEAEFGILDHPAKRCALWREQHPANLGIVESVRMFLNCLWARLFPRRPEDSFEDWVRNRFGDRLYRTFFKTYTEKVWGVPARRSAPTGPPSGSMGSRS